MVSERKRRETVWMGWGLIALGITLQQLQRHTATPPLQPHVDPRERERERERERGGKTVSEPHHTCTRCPHTNALHVHLITDSKVAGRPRSNTMIAAIAYL
jgi:hypothetical protein